MPGRGLRGVPLGRMAIFHERHGLTRLLHKHNLAASTSSPANTPGPRRSSAGPRRGSAGVHRLLQVREEQKTALSYKMVPFTAANTPSPQEQHHLSATKSWSRGKLSSVPHTGTVHLLKPFTFE